MNTNKVQNRVYVSDRTLNRTVKKANHVAYGYVSNNNVSFKGASSDFAKKFWFNLRRLGNQMKDNTEMQNALIAAIGTGIIAPATILVSPGKGDEQDKKKKFTQALRQPISALFALGFQVPATMLITIEMDKLVFDEDGFPYVSYMAEDEDTGDMKEVKYLPSFQVELEGPRFFDE